MRRRALLAVPLATPALAQQPIVLTLATATPGGGFPAFGDAFAAAIHAADPGITIQPRNTAGSGENPRLLAAREVDLGLVAGEPAMTALRGNTGITLLVAMYGQPGLFGLRPDSPHSTIASLRGQRIAWGARGSAFVVLARQTMGGLGLDIDRDFEPVLLDRAADGPAMVLDGRVAALWGGGAGWPGFNTLAAAPGGLRFIAPDPAERARILAAQPALQAMELPAGSYPGQTTAIPSVGTWSLVLARPGLDDGMAHRLASAIHHAGADMTRRLPQASETTLANTLAAAPEHIHPGVRRFMATAGIIR